uniref:Uncharacterized protein n=1 Tax=Quercus lobata TaxID=97700 RepID=A0A7N2MZE8_QUELO
MEEIRVQLEKPKLESLPLHSELEPIITERFPGVYSCMVDAIIRAFAVDANAEIPFRCSIYELLFLKGPFGDNYAYKSIYFQDVSETELKRPITKERSFPWENLGSNAPSPLVLNRERVKAEKERKKEKRRSRSRRWRRRSISWLIIGLQQEYKKHDYGTRNKC